MTITFPVLLVTAPSAHAQVGSFDVVRGDSDDVRTDSVPTGVNATPSGFLVGLEQNVHDTGVGELRER